jgi:hypothetical protein
MMKQSVNFCSLEASLLPLLHLRFRFRFVPPLLPNPTPLLSQFECIGVVLLSHESWIEPCTSYMFPLLAQKRSIFDAI